MSIEINNNTVIRLVIRRGPNSDRLLSNLAQGELGYTTDTRRLFIGNGQPGDDTVAGNVFLGITPTPSLFESVAVVGDSIYNEVDGTLNVWTQDGTWYPIMPHLGLNMFYSSGGISVGPGLAGTGFQLLTSDGRLNFDPNFATVFSTTNSTSGFYIGVSPGSFTDSIFQTQGSISILNSVGDTRGIILSADNTSSTLVFNGSGNIIGAGDKTLIIKNGTPSIDISTFERVLTADPSFVFKNGLVEMQSLYVTGPAWVETLSSNNIYVTTTILSNATAATFNTTDNLTPGLTTVRILDYNVLPGDVLLDCIGTTTSGASASIFNVRYSADGGPYVGINTTTQYTDASGHFLYHLGVSGGVWFEGGPIMMNSGLTITGDLSATGDIIAFAPSDERLKDNIIQIDSALAKTLALRGVTFEWNNNSNRSGKDVGLIAQDVQKQIPEAVTTRQDGYLGMQYDKVIPVLVEAIRELNAKVDKLTKQINELS